MINGNGTIQPLIGCDRFGDSMMIRKLEEIVLSSQLSQKLLFNDISGAFAEYIEAARDRRRYREYRDRYDIDDSFAFRGPAIELYGRGSIELGANSYIGHHSRLQAKDDAIIHIGSNTAVSHFVFMYTQNRVADQDMSQCLNRNEHLEVETMDVSVGSDCWIGAFTFITQGSTVGDNTVVGAHSVVTRDLPPDCIAAGAPAQVRQFKSYLDEEEAQSLAREYKPVVAEPLRGRYDLE